MKKVQTINISMFSRYKNRGWTVIVETKKETNKNKTLVKK